MTRHKAYRNLNKRDAVVYSLAFRGKVIDYRTCVVLRDAKLKHATPAALQRIRSGPREVCAWVLGTLDDSHDGSVVGLRKMRCDPKSVDTFQDAETGETVDSASLIVLRDDGAFYQS